MECATGETGMSSSHKRLHWTQRIALARYSLHAATRTGDYSFFTAVQARCFTDGTDHLAQLQSILGNDADKLFQVLDNLNSGIAWAYEDACKAVYDKLDVIATSYTGADVEYSVRSQLHDEALEQRACADGAIDKMMSNAITLIQQHPSQGQDPAAGIFILGLTFIVDALKVCLMQLAVLETCTVDTDRPRADAALSRVRFSVSAATSALRGALTMMESHDDPVGEAAARAHRELTSPPQSPERRSSGASSVLSPSHKHTRSSASSSGWNTVLRRMSQAFSAGGGPQVARADPASSSSAAPPSTPTATLTHVDSRPPMAQHRSSASQVFKPKSPTLEADKPLPSLSAPQSHSTPLSSPPPPPPPPPPSSPKSSAPTENAHAFANNASSAPRDLTGHAEMVVAIPRDSASATSRPDAVSPSVLRRRRSTNVAGSAPRLDELVVGMAV